MASRIWRDVQTPKRSRKIISGSFSPNGAAGVNSVKGVGINSVFRFDVGQYAVFLRDSYVGFDSVTAGLRLAAVADRFVRTSTLTQVVLDGRLVSVFNVVITDGANAPQDVAADANNVVHFTAILMNN